MGLKWTDIHEIAMQLADGHEDIDPLQVRFTDLRRWILELPEFDDDPDRSGEKLLEAIQQAWIEEMD